MLNFYSENSPKAIFCSIPEHENSRISFICLQEHCQASSRLGCAYCFLENHQSHVSEKLKIADFEQKVQEKCEKLSLNFSRNLEENEGIIDRIEADCDILKRDFLKNIEIIQENLIDFYKKRMKKATFEREKLMENVINLKENTKKSSLFLMNNSEIEEQIQIFLDKNLPKKQDNFLKEFLEKHQRIKETIRAYLKDFRKDFEGFFNNLCENNGISSILKEKLHEKLKENLKEKFNEKSAKKPDISMNLLEKTMKKQIKDVISLTFCEKPHKRAHWSEFLKKNAKNLFTIFKQNSCEHITKVKIAMIFPCCNQAFLCIKCHDKGNSHKWDVKKDVFLCYCLKCFTILKFKEEKCNNCLLSLK